MSQIVFTKRVSLVSVMIFMVILSSNLFSKVEIVNHTDKYSQLAPAGSLESLKFSIKNNIDYDLDVQLSKDGELILSHDSVSKYTWKQLRKKRIAPSHYSGEYANSKYIRLDEVLAYMQDNPSSIKLHLDVKSFNTRSNGAFQKTLNRINDYGLFNRVYFWIRSINQKDSAKNLKYGNKAHFALWVEYNVKLAIKASKSNNSNGIDMIGFRYKKVYDGGYSLENITDILHNKNIKISVYGIPQNNSFITNYQNIDYFSASKAEQLLKISYFKNNKKEEVENIIIDKDKKVEEIDIEDIPYESNGKFKIKFEAEDKFIKVNDIGKNKIAIGSNIDANKNKFVSIFDKGDSVKFKFFIDESNEFSLALRMRSGYPTDTNIYFDDQYYSVKIDGQEVEYFSDEYSISNNPSTKVYWGIVNSEYVYFDKGEHSVEIEMKTTARTAWGAIDSVAIEY